MSTQDKIYLVIMRHAKSDAALPGQSDFDRTLSSRGMSQPSIIKQRLDELGIGVENILLSPSQRTTETAAILFPDQSDRVQSDMRLYNAYCDDMLTVLDELFGHENTILIAHCPGVAELCYFLCGEQVNFSPATAVVLSISKEAEQNIFNTPRQFHLEHVLVADA